MNSADKTKTLEELWDGMVKAAVEEDDERAHSYEDSYREKVLQMIADGHPDAINLAKKALSTNNFDFARWCA